jgi:hypothetical protein
VVRRHEKESRDREKTARIDGARAASSARAGFLVVNEIGLGDVIKRVTSSVGMTPCGSCERRAAALNRRIRFTRRQK